MKNALQYVTDSTSHCPCDDCHYSRHCKHECTWFKDYVKTESPKKREALIIQFKADPAELKYMG